MTSWMSAAGHFVFLPHRGCQQLCLPPDSFFPSAVYSFHPRAWRFSPRLLVWQAWHWLPFCVARVALGDIDLHFVWQAWHFCHWAGSGGAFGSRGCRRLRDHFDRAATSIDDAKLLNCVIDKPRSTQSNHHLKLRSLQKPDILWRWLPFPLEVCMPEKPGHHTFQMRV